MSAETKPVPPIEVSALKISAMIHHCKIEERGALYNRVAFHLERRGQNYQASLFRALAQVA
jgi:hypothetical protein